MKFVHIVQFIFVFNSTSQPFTLWSEGDFSGFTSLEQRVEFGRLVLTTSMWLMLIVLRACLKYLRWTVQKLHFKALIFSLWNQELHKWRGQILNLCILALLWMRVWSKTSKMTLAGLRYPWKCLAQVRSLMFTIHSSCSCAPTIPPNRSVYTRNLIQWVALKSHEQYYGDLYVQWPLITVVIKYSQQTAHEHSTCEKYIQDGCSETLYELKERLALVSLLWIAYSALNIQ